MGTEGQSVFLVKSDGLKQHSLVASFEECWVVVIGPSENEPFCPMAVNHMRGSACLAAFLWALFQITFLAF